jgi:hypothetical protein
MTSCSYHNYPSGTESLPVVLCGRARGHLFIRRKRAWNERASIDRVWTMQFVTFSWNNGNKVPRSTEERLLYHKGAKS